MDYATIRAVAVHLPPLTERNDVPARLAKALGIERRHVASWDQATSDLAVAAAEQLFTMFPQARTGVDFVLLCTQHPDYVLPATACLVADRLGLPKGVGALDYNLGCSGYVYGLALAKGLVETGLSRRLLLLTAVLTARNVPPTKVGWRALFGDAATATLIDAVPRERPALSAFVFGTDGAGTEAVVQYRGGTRRPFTVNDRATVDGVHLDLGFNMNDDAVTAFMLRTVPPLVDSVLAKAGVDRAGLDQVVFHQPNRLMLDHLRRRCRLGDTPFFNNLAETGNTASSSVPIGLHDVLSRRPPTELRRVLLAGFGIGLSWAGCMADLTDAWVGGASS